tara:strand:+ start:509 stop:937 length:429 start_codon:yes stop_codon:yes gene_type:complete
MKITIATETDLSPIAELFMIEFAKEPYFEKWSERGAIQRIKQYFKDSKIYVAKNDQNIVGFIIISTFLWYTGLAGNINEFIVAKKYQNQGIGTKLLEVASTYFKNKNVKQIDLITHQKAKAVGFYEKLGFKKKEYVYFSKKL